MVASLPHLYSIGELSDMVNRWCDENQVAPANGQAGEKITERNIRYYRSRGLIDPPGSDELGRKRGFTERHLLQLKAIRLLQARGLPLDQIQAKIEGRSSEDLRTLERIELRLLRGVGPEHGAMPTGISPAEIFGAEGERWGVSSLTPEFLLVSRRGRTLSNVQRRMIAAVLNGAFEEAAAISGENGVGKAKELQLPF